MVKEFGPVRCVGGGAKDVHHHEVLYVELLAPWLLQLVDVVPINQFIIYFVKPS